MSMDRWKEQLKKRWKRNGAEGTRRIFRHKSHGQNAQEQSLKVLYTEHTLSAEQLADLFPLARIDARNVLGSRGISRDEARLRLADQCRARRSRSLRAALRSLRRCLCSPFAFLLACSVLLCLLTLLLDPPSRPTVVPLVLLQALVLALIIGIGAFERSRIRRLGSSFHKGAVSGQPPTCYSVVREGIQMAIREKDILPGDLLWVETAQRVPADLRILHVDPDFLADTSWMTGCTEPLAEFTANQAPAHSDLFRVRNMLFAEFTCTRGRALGFVVRTRKNTLFSRLLSLKPYLHGSSTSTDHHHQDSVLQHSYRLLVRCLVWASLALSSAALLLSFLLSDFAHPFHSFVHIFLVVLIAAVPQALPLTLSAQFLLMARRLNRKCGGMLLRRMKTADALGRTSVLMVHSSAVFTANRPTVTDLWLAGQNKVIPTGSLVEEGPKEKFGSTIMEMLKTIAFCTRTTQRTDGQVDHPSKCHKVPMPDHPICASLPSKKAPLNRVTSYLAHKADLSGMTTVSGQRPEDSAMLKFLAQLDPVNLFRDEHQCILRENQFPDGILPADLPPSMDLVVLNESARENHHHGHRHHRLLLRGPAEDIFRMCTKVRGTEGTDDDELIDDKHMAEFEDTFLALSGQAKSCVGFAVLDLYSDDEHDDDDADDNDVVFASVSPPLPPPSLLLTPSSSSPSSAMVGEWDRRMATMTMGSSSSSTNASTSDSPLWCFLGMLALADPPLNECRTQISALNNSSSSSSSDGVRLVLLSDQHPLVAEAVAEQLGLVGQAQKDQQGRISVIQMPLDNCAGPFGPKSLQKSMSTSSSSGYHSSDRSDNEEKGKSNHRQQKQNNDENLESGELDLGKKLYAQMMSFSSADSGRHAVFSQLDPQQILALINELQSHGHSVTFVGDDPLRDGPALRLANVGIGRSEGSVLLREAADVLCGNVALPNLMRAIGESRLLVDNLASTLAFSLSFTLPALFPVLLALLLSLPPALTSVQTLTVTLVAQVPPAIALVLQRSTTNASPGNHKRRRPLAPMALLLYAYLIAGFLITLGSLLAYLSVFWQSGATISVDLLDSTQFWWNNAQNLTIASGSICCGQSGGQSDLIIGQARAAWLLTLIGTQLVHVWICAGLMRRCWWDTKIFHNWPLWLALLFDLALLCLLIYVPSLNLAFGTQPPPLWIWLFPVGTALALFAINVFTKLAIRFVRKRASKKGVDRVLLLLDW